MRDFIKFLSADYSRSRIDKLTTFTMLAGLPVAVFARWDVVRAVFL